MDKTLNPQQLEAIQHQSGPLLVIAGAGTGKTTVITERIKYLLSSGLAQSHEILALTFTEKAAAEMQDRLDEVMPLSYSKMFIGTFHSFCEQFLRDNGIHIGLDYEFDLLTEVDAVALFKKNIYKFKLDYYRPLGNPYRFIEAILKHFSRLKDENVSPVEYLKFVKDANDIELANLYTEWEQIKADNSVLEFADLIYYTLKVLLDRPKIKDIYQGKYKYILVDEYQDTNYAQNEILKILRNKQMNINVVGDDDQCLPPESLIAIPDGVREIKDISPDDKIITAIGRGYLGISKVNKVIKTVKQTKFVTFTTESGKILTVTGNHKLFSFMPGKNYGNHSYYVYLMQRINLGWRIGITNDIPVRLKLERSADRIVAVRRCKTEEEARYYETLYSLKYCIPSLPFKPRKNMKMVGIWLDKLYSEIDSERGALILARDLGIDLHFHHFCLGGVTRGGSKRAKIIVEICQRSYPPKKAKRRLVLNSQILHTVGLETSKKEVLEKLKKNNIEVYKAKKGWKLRRSFSQLDDAEIFADKLAKITGAIFEEKFTVAKQNRYSRISLVMPAGNILTGMWIPVAYKYEVKYEKVVSRTEEIRTETVFDLEVDKTHNFIANGIVVHNSIYRFRGAAMGNLLSYPETYPETKIVTLTQNYRSGQNILDAAYKLISNNNPDRLEVKANIDKKLVALPDKPNGDVVFQKFARGEDEAEWVATQIHDNFKDHAILVRSNSQAEPFIKALERAGIPVQFLGPAQLFTQPEIKDLIAILRVIDNPEDDISLYRVLAMDIWKLDKNYIANLFAKTRHTGKTLFEICGDENIGAINFIKSAITKSANQSAGQILYDFLVETKILNSLDEETRAKNIAKFFKRVKSFEDRRDASVRTVVDWIDLNMQMGESPQASVDSDWRQNDAVNILTVHSAKGLEFETVFMTNLVMERFPSRNRSEQLPIPTELIKEKSPELDFHLQEERRLFYVGMTRAKSKLYLTASDYYGETKRAKKVSLFVSETGASIQELGDSPKHNLSNHPKPKTSSYQLAPISSLSYSHISSFEECPAHYRAKYILGISEPATSMTTLGTVVHKALNSDNPLETYRTSWRDAGFMSPQQKKDTKNLGEELIIKYLSDEKYSKHKSKYTEHQFSIPISADLKITGRMDRVDVWDDGTVEIIDYKTSSKLPEQKEVDKNLQLSFYALAADALMLGSKIKLTLYYLQFGQAISTTRSVEDLEKAREKIIKIRDEIQSSDFACTGFFCDSCAFKMLCDKR